MTKASARADQPTPPTDQVASVTFPTMQAVMSEPFDMLEEDDVRPDRDALSIMQDQEAPANFVAPDIVQYAETTYFWHLEDGPDRDYARAYVAEKYPYSQAMVVSELLIPRLNEQNHVIILSRPNPRKYPIIREWKDEKGYRQQEPLPLADCIKGIRESPAIPVGKFITGASRFSIGKFNADAFFDECSRYFFGGRMRVQGKEMTIRFLAG